MYVGLGCRGGCGLGVGPLTLEEQAAQQQRCEEARALAPLGLPIPPECRTVQQLPPVEVTAPFPWPTVAALAVVALVILGKRR